jgi:hypothetical protein
VSASTSGSVDRRHVVHRARRRLGRQLRQLEHGAAMRDVGTVMDFGPVQPPGCKGKVDLLFVISRQARW